MVNPTMCPLHSFGFLLSYSESERATAASIYSLLHSSELSPPLSLAGRTSIQDIIVIPNIYLESSLNSL